MIEYSTNKLGLDLDMIVIFIYYILISTKALACSEERINFPQIPLFGSGDSIVYNIDSIRRIRREIFPSHSSTIYGIYGNFPTFLFTLLPSQGVLVS